VYENSRIHLGSDKKELVSARLGKRLRHLDLHTYSEYCRLLESPAGVEELAHLVDVISTNFTNFFRENGHFEFLEETILKEWLSRQKAKREGDGCLHVWSAAASSGEEPYSIGVMLAEHTAELQGLDWHVEATDISTRMIEKARSGIYEKERLSQVSQAWIQRYFQYGSGKWEGYYRVRPELRSKIAFQCLNLLQATYPFSRKFHVIFCRNVMIYFDRATQEQLVGNLCSQLLPGGYLIIGHSETLTSVSHPLKIVRPSIYYKPHTEHS